MPKVFSRIADAPIGAGLAALNDGLTVTTTLDAVNLRVARSDTAHSAGTRGAEFTFWGDAALVATIGVIKPTDSQGGMLGSTSGAVGWRLDQGKVYINNVAVVSGLPVPAKGDIVGVRVELDSGPQMVRFYLNDVEVDARALPAAGASWHYAIGLTAPLAGTLAAAVNAGQWQGISGAVIGAGWEIPQVAVSTTRLADSDYLTAGTDAPAHARYEGLIDDVGLTIVQEMAFWPWGGDLPTQGAAGTLRINDAEGVLDALAQADVSRVPVAVRMGATDAALAASTPVGRYIGTGLEVLDDGRKVLHLADAHDDLDDPINPGVFLPSIPQLAWHAQPAVIGAVASAPVLAANSDGSVGFLSDAPLASVDAVLDRGDAMEAGTYALDPTFGQQLLLQSPPAGPMVADVSSIGAGPAPATLQQALAEIFRRIHKAAWSAADAAAIDAATGYTGIGYYAGDATSARTALAAILPSYGAWWWQDETGVIRLSRVIDPDTVAEGALAFDLALDDCAADPVVMPDDAPNLSRRMAWRPNAYPFSAGDLVTDLVDVPPQRRIELTSGWRGIVRSAAPLPTRYAHADSNPPLVSCFWEEADAQAEIRRVVALYAQPRFFHVWRITDPALAPHPGDVGRIAYPRYGLEAGRQVLVRGVQRNPVTGAVTLTLWG